jgi:phenylalanyl-tRNA synthetase beta chain
MKISYNWLKDYINIDLPAAEVADILTNTGLEVEKIHDFISIKGGLEGLVVGHITSKEQHPNADKLSVTKIDIGTGEELSIVCGAPNVAKGLKVIVATIGTTLYDGEDSFKIKKSKLRGELSEGMICGENEVGLGSDTTGIMELPADTEIGMLAKDLFKVEEDTIFEIGLTPNRSDAMGHVGVARDIAAALNVFNKEKSSYHYPTFTMPEKVSSNKKIDVIVEDVENCPRYASILIDNVQVKDSPKWLQDKLKSIGLKPINNIVDITNFVLKEYAQPLHAFDADKIIGNKVIVKKVSAKTKFVCLDETALELSSEDLMICNEKEPMCIAGVFGGAKSGVSKATKTIFLESAYFDSKSVRKTSTRHKLQTDAASRYEKGADPNISIEALKRAASLICELANGQIISNIQDFYPTKIEDFKVDFRYSRLNQLTGVTIPKDMVKQILADLEIDVLVETDDVLSLAVKPYRADVLREVDVIEEVMRIYGFNNIETPTAVHSTLSFGKGIDKNFLKNAISDNLNGFGYSEIMTNSISKSEFYGDEAKEKLVKLQNNMTAELDIMRSTLLFDGLEVLAYNINRKMPNLKFFEFGSIYNQDYSQDEKLVLFQTGFDKEQNWKRKAEKSNFYHLLTTVKAVLKQMKVKDYEILEIENNSFEYCVNLVRNEKVLATIGLVTAKILKAQEIKQEVFFAEIDWDLILKIYKKNKIKYVQVSKFPEVKRDLALILDESVPFEMIKNHIYKAARKYLTNIELFDIYRDAEKIGANKKSYAVSLTLLNKDKTLIDKEIDKIIAKIVRTLQNETNATIRG